MRTGYFVVVCATNCVACNTNGASKCDPGMCYRDFVYDNNTESCVGEWNDFE